MSRILHEPLKLGLILLIPLLLTISAFVCLQTAARPAHASDCQPAFQSPAEPCLLAMSAHDVDAFIAVTAMDKFSPIVAAAALIILVPVFWAGTQERFFIVFRRWRLALNDALRPRIPIFLSLSQGLLQPKLYA